MFSNLDWSVALNGAIAIATGAYAILALYLLRAVKSQVQAQVNANEIQSFLFMVDRLEDTRDERQLIREFIKQGRSALSSPLTREEHEAFERVCRAFDILGLFEGAHMVRTDLVRDFYASPLIELYDGALRDYIDDLRKKGRHAGHFGKLRQLYERMKQ